MGNGVNHPGGSGKQHRARMSEYFHPAGEGAGHVYQFAKAARIMYHKLGGLNNGSSLPHSWEFQNQGVIRVGSSRGP